MQPPKGCPLTMKQWEVVRLARRGMIDDEIAALRKCSDSSIRSLLMGARQRLGCKTTRQMIAECEKRGWFGQAWHARNTHPMMPDGCPLSPGQFEALRWAEMGCGPTLIAERTTMTIAGAHSHLHRGAHRLGVRGISAAVKVFRERGWQEVPLPVAAKLYLAAFERFLRQWRDQLAQARARREMKYLLPVLFLEVGLPVPDLDRITRGLHDQLGHPGVFELFCEPAA
jgi:DNA-binding CsgD family transcriptional regulator